jgi:NAD(P)-dependent dehydrogenase (short-subunit alcohol dehydrogenase family)
MTKLTYEGRRVIVAGGGGAGMGAAAARLARELGAEVTVLDLRPPADARGISFLATDLSDPDQIGRAVEKVGGPVHALFNCQGISGSAPGTSSELVMRVNFLGLRHLSETVLPLMPAGGAVASISSSGGMGWPRRLETIRELLAAESFEEGLRWVAARTAELLALAFPNAYAFSKQAVIVWTMRRAVTAIARGVRVNCTSPGSTRTPMSPDFPAEGVEYTSRPSGRGSSPDEQAWPLVFLNSDAASYVNGVNLAVDGGHSSARTLGLLQPPGA